MYKANLEFRKLHQLDTCIGVEYPEKAQALEYYPRGYVGVDKMGRPLYVERIGKLRQKELIDLCSEDRMFSCFY